MQKPTYSALKKSSECKWKDFFVYLYIIKEEDTVTWIDIKEYCAQWNPTFLSSADHDSCVYALFSCKVITQREKISHYTERVRSVSNPTYDWKTQWKLLCCHNFSQRTLHHKDYICCITLRTRQFAYCFD